MTDMLPRPTLAAAALALAALAAPILANVPAYGVEAGTLPASTSSRPHVTHASHHRHHRAPAPGAQAASLHLPPTSVPPAESAAPVPDENVLPPQDRSTPETNVAPDIFALHYPSSGEGYIAGSSPSTIDNEHAAQIGGVQLQVPLK